MKPLASFDHQPEFGPEPEPAADLARWELIAQACAPQVATLQRRHDPRASREDRALLACRMFCTAVGLPGYCPKASCRRAMACMSPSGGADTPTWCWRHLVRPDPVVHAILVRALGERVVESRARQPDCDQAST